MLAFLMPVVFATAMITTTQQASSSSVPLHVFTQALPEGNFVAYHAEAHDSLKGISFVYYSSDAYWVNLWNDNPTIKQPEDLEEGTLVKIQVQKQQKPDELSLLLQNRLPKPQPQVQPIALAQTEAPQMSYMDVYKAAGAKYGVSWQILYGIHMTETGGRNGHILSHLGNGPQGPMQFMPGTFAAYAVDGDGDGVADIDNATDAIFTAANYLSKHGSLLDGLRSYGGNIEGTFSYARAVGFNQ